MCVSGKIAGGIVFKNELEVFKDKEMYSCNYMASESHYMTGSGPYAESTLGFKNLLESGERVKFILSERGMFIGKTNICHSSIACFQQVITAGHVKCLKTVTELVSGEKRTVCSLEIDNETGHYRTTAISLEAAIIRFKCLGYGLSVAKDWKTNQPIGLDEKCKKLPPERDHSSVLSRI